MSNENWFYLISIIFFIVAVIKIYSQVKTLLYSNQSTFCLFHDKLKFATNITTENTIHQNFYQINSWSITLMISFDKKHCVMITSWRTSKVWLLSKNESTFYKTVVLFLICIALLKTSEAKPTCNTMIWIIVGFLSINVSTLNWKDIFFCSIQRWSRNAVFFCQSFFYCFNISKKRKRIGMCILYELI